MAYYDKKIIYLSEMEYGNRIKGAGFARMECRGESCSFDVHVSGMKSLAEKKYDIFVVSVQGRKYLAGRIFLYKGGGEWKGVYGDGRIRDISKGDAGDWKEGNGRESRQPNKEEGICYGEIAEISVKISDTKALVGKLPCQGKSMQAAEITAERNPVRAGEEEKGGTEGKGMWKFVRGGKKQTESEEDGDRERPEIGKDGENRHSGEAERAGKNSQARGMETVGGNCQAKETASTGTGRQRSGYGQAEEKGRPEKKENITQKRENMGAENASRQTGNEIRETGRQEKREKKEEGKQYENIANRMERKKGAGKEKKNGNVVEEGKIQIDDVILNDKWDQLKQLYSVVHPYEDDRQYIAIQPKDFVIMTGDYQHLANNSFLLHGFYNYRHIVLGRERDGNFYLGVPGVYYEREKMVALMFGFEAFECDGGKAEAGKFGYYLRKVKI